MTFAEILLAICLLVGLYYLLRPLRNFIELAVLKLLGKNPKWVDAVIVKKEKD